jgi:hypothetical protein
VAGILHDLAMVERVRQDVILQRDQTAFAPPSRG